MASIKLEHKNLHGKLDIGAVAPSKSILHREIICAALSHAPELPFFDSKDIMATYNTMSHILSDDRECFVGESASTLRFLIPLSILLGGRTFITAGKLSERPLNEYDCIRHGRIKINGNVIRTAGELLPDEFTLRGDVSSQFISGLLFALPLLNGDSSIHITTQLQSKSYVDLTISSQKRHGVEVTQTQDGYLIIGNQSYKSPESYSVEGDWSYAAFFIVANHLGANISLTGLNPHSLQGDKAILELLTATEIDISQTPDLFPILCVLACGRNEKTHIYNGARLRLKESDRLSAMAQELKKLGAQLTEGTDYITINGTGSLHGGEVSSHSDHRIAMALAIAATTICTEPVTILNSECIEKSAPNFFEHLCSLS